MPFNLTKLLEIIDRVYNYIFAMIFSVVLAVSLYAIFDSMYVVEQGGEIEEAINRIDDSEKDNRVKAMKKINDEIIAWITIDDTKINYPVTQAKNNYFYLDHNYEKKYSIAGSIFADYRNDIRKDMYTVIYGHNMDGQKMFGYLSEFDKEEFFNAHKTGKIYFEDNSYDLEILTYGIVENKTRAIYNIEKNRNDIDVVLNTLQPLAKHKRDVKKQKYLLLSTCSSDMTKRVVLLVGYNE